jgi:CheY-like chemotaxis protein
VKLAELNQEGARSAAQSGLVALLPIGATEVHGNHLPVGTDCFLAQAVTDRVAMVLTDLEMPEMDGFTLTRNIKQDARFSGLPVVIHSSLSGSANEDHVRSVGADGYVAKFVAEELAETIRRVLPH